MRKQSLMQSDMQCVIQMLRRHAKTKLDTKRHAMCYTNVIQSLCTTSAVKVMFYKCVCVRVCVCVCKLDVVFCSLCVHVRLQMSTCHRKRHRANKSVSRLRTNLWLLELRYTIVLVCCLCECACACACAACTLWFTLEHMKLRRCFAIASNSICMTKLPLKQMC